MAFMVPEYYYGRMIDAEEGSEGGTGYVPLEYYSRKDHGKADPCGPFQDGWFVRLSAPGYLDCTDWDGPFDTEEAAREHCKDTWEVDPDTGDELPDEE